MPLKAFISYSHHDRAQGARVKRELEWLGVECFLAHDDIRVSEEWKARIVEELSQSNILISLLSESFKASDWTSQEVGYMVSKSNVLIIPLLLDDTIPYGFISHLQGHRFDSALSAPDFFVSPIAARFPREIIPELLERMGRAGAFREAERLMRPLVPLFEVFSDEEIVKFVEKSISNGQIWDASQCKSEYLPRLIEVHGERIPRAKLQQLRTLIEQ